jgi:Domain of unknown function (DUF4145)
MAELVANCPRCGTKSITMDVKELNLVEKRYGWLKTYEAFGVCRNCNLCTIFVIDERDDHDHEMFERKMPPLQLTNVTMNSFFNIRGFVGLKDQATVASPEHVPPNIASVFREGATCLRVECWNAAGTMFRLCVDLATQPMLPEEDMQGLNQKTRRDLGLRLPWLFANGKLPTDLHEFSTAIKDDGNDGAHRGTLTKEDAEDLLDFTRALLERVFTEPEKLKLAEARREQRRAPKK